MDWPIIVNISYTLNAADILDWLEECVGEIDISWDWQHINNRNYVCFASEEDLLACKLKFGI
jgi:hypothetical protein